MAHDFFFGQVVEQLHIQLHCFLGHCLLETESYYSPLSSQQIIQRQIHIIVVSFQGVYDLVRIKIHGDE